MNPISFLIVLLAILLLVWLFSPAPTPRWRRRLSGVGRSVFTLATCSGGVRLTVETSAGGLICEFEKRPDTGGVEQDIRMMIPDVLFSPDGLEQLRSALTGSGLLWRARPSGKEISEVHSAFTEVSLFGRREDIGLDAIRATECVASALGLELEGRYVFRQHGGHVDSQLMARLGEDMIGRPDALAKVKRLKELV
jgi:hypothetical protein